jgi:hypothetical protein
MNVSKTPQNPALIQMEKVRISARLQACHAGLLLHFGFSRCGLPWLGLSG